MKSLSILPIMALVTAGWITAYGQNPEPEVPGDQFSLEGALELFKKSASPEEFEKLLNSSDSKVNNLDLNGDGYVDYIRVFDRYDGNVHAFVLQAMISESESQDIAVIELEKLANGKAVLQIVGDEAVYGVETIIEPTREVRTYAGTQTTPAIVNVWAWPTVQYVYGPRYVAWVSPWRWHRMPVWYIGWQPVAYVHYYPIWRPYHRYYAPCYTRRIVYAPHIYRPYRTVSVVVSNRYNDKITHYRSTHRDDNRYGRRRHDDRSYVSNNRSAQRSTDVRRPEVVENRRYPAGREVVKPSPAENSPKRTAPPQTRRPYAVQKPQTAEGSRTTGPNRVETPQLATPPAGYDKRGAQPVRTTTRQYLPQRSAPADIPRSSEVKRSAPTNVHQNTAVQRSRTAPEQKPAAVSRERHSGVPMARPSAPTRGSRGTPAVQQRSYDRPSGAARSDSNRRGRH